MFPLVEDTKVTEKIRELQSVPRPQIPTVCWPLVRVILARQGGVTVPLSTLRIAQKMQLLFDSQ